MAEMKHQIPIKAAPAKVYAALATQAGLRGWWTADSTTAEKIGGNAEFGFDKRGMIFHMKIEELDPATLVVWSCHGDHPEWNGTRLTWKLSPQNGGTVVRFSHSNWKDASEFYDTCNSTWGELMHRLRDYAEGKNPGPHWKE